jgi:hypothetical protein
MIDLDKLEALAKAAPSGKWQVWTSNSWRRVYADQGRDKVRVIEPATHRDHHPDLMFGSGVEAWLEGFTPDLALELIAEVRRLRETLSTPLFTGADAPMYGGIFGVEGANRTVAERAFYAGAPHVTVYYGEKRIFLSVAEFCAVHPKDQP